jgi:DnaJ-class molecular chaperone
MDMACRFPGCVVVPADGSDVCVVHRDASLGKPCETCRGSGWLTKGMPCPECGGVGLRDAKRSMVIPKRERVPVDERAEIKKIESGDDKETS